MKKRFLKRRAKNIAASLAALMLLEVSPLIPEDLLSLGAAATIVHERPRQRGNGEFYRIPEKKKSAAEEKKEAPEEPLEAVKARAEEKTEELVEEAAETATNEIKPEEVGAKADEEQEDTSPEAAEEEQAATKTAEEEENQPVQQPAPEVAVIETAPAAGAALNETAFKDTSLKEAVETTAVEAVKPLEEKVAEGKETLKEKKKKAKAEKRAAKKAEREAQKAQEAEAKAQAEQKPPGSPQTAPAKESVNKQSAVAKPQKMTQLPMLSQDIGGTLLLSDNPEYVENTGIYYQDQVKGDVRALYYHVNRTHKSLRTAVVLENKGDSYSVVHITRTGISLPSPDYLAVGKETQLAYFGKQNANGFILGPGEKRVLCREQEQLTLEPDDLIYGCIDFTVSNPVIATILVYDAHKDPLEYVGKAKVIKPTDNQLRGSYTGMDRIMTSLKEYNPRRDGVVYFQIGDGEADAFRSGIDATDGTIMTNTGNYGIVYNISIPYRKGGFRAYLAPRGGVYAGVVNVEVNSEPGVTTRVETPEGSGWDFGVSGLPEKSFPNQKGECMLTPEDEATALGHFVSKGILKLELSPPGASNLPVRIILVPDGLEPLASDAKRG